MNKFCGELQPMWEAYGDRVYTTTRRDVRPSNTRKHDLLFTVSQ